jgi:hypothetical protein
MVANKKRADRKVVYRAGPARSARGRPPRNRRNERPTGEPRQKTAACSKRKRKGSCCVASSPQGPSTPAL